MSPVEKHKAERGTMVSRLKVCEHDLNTLKNSSVVLNKIDMYKNKIKELDKTIEQLENEAD